jgi:hypothetical protein
MGTQIIVDIPEAVSEQARRKAREAALLALWESGELSASRIDRLDEGSGYRLECSSRTRPDAGGTIRHRSRRL